LAKRGLVVTYYFPPSGGGGVQRWAKIIKYLSRLDWKITVITAPIEPGIPIDKTLLDDIPPQVKIVRSSMTSETSSILMKLAALIPRGYWQRWISASINITDSRGYWNNHARSLIEKEIDSNEYHALFFSIPPYSIADLAAEYTRLLNIPVFLDMRDPWTINPYKIYPTIFHRYLDRRKEKKIIADIDNIISVYKSIPQEYDRIIPSFSKTNVHIISNGFDEEDFNDFKSVNIQKGSGLNLAFSGTFYSHLNRPDKLFAAIRNLKSEGINVRFHHIGDSAFDVERVAKKYGIGDQITLWNYQDHKSCLEILNAMDAFCVILDPDNKMSVNTIGGKLYEYLRLRKPILGIVPESGEAANLIQETNSGIVCGNNTPISIAVALKELIDDSRVNRFIGIEKYARKNQAAEIDKIVMDKIK